MACRLNSAKPVPNPVLKLRSLFKTFNFHLAIYIWQFCLRANEIRYQYVYHRQQLGIYIYIYIHTYIYIYIYIHTYIYIRLSVYIKQGGGGVVTMTTPRHHRLLPQRYGATSDHIVVTPTALPRSVQYIGVTLITVRQYIYGMNMSALATIWLRI